MACCGVLPSMSSSRNDGSWLSNAASQRLPRQLPRKSAPKSPKIYCQSKITGSSRKLSDSKDYSIYRRPVNKRRPLTDDGARRVIRERAIWESQLRKNQGPKAKGQKWIRRTPEQMARFLANGRMEYRFEQHVESAISTTRKLVSKPTGSYDFNVVMKRWVGRLSFKEMCIVLKEQKNWVQAREFFEWMKLQVCYRLSVISYTILLRIYAQAGRIDLVEELYTEMLEEGCEPDEVAICSMICVYARQGQINCMMEFYDMMREQGLVPPIVVFNSMLSSLYKACLYLDAIHLWKDVIDAGVSPNDYTYAVVVNVYRREGKIEDALQVFEEMQKAGHLPDEILCNIVINMMGKLGRQDDILETFEKMKAQGLVPSKYTYTYLVHFFGKEKAYKLAATFFSEMQSHGYEADEVVYGTIISIYSELGMYNDAEHAFREMEKAGLMITERVFILMANVRMKAGKYYLALELLEEMQSRGLQMTKFAWIIVLQCCMKQRKVGHAESAFQAMLKCGFGDTVAFTCMFTLYREMNLFEDGKKLLSKLQNSNVEPDEQLYGAIINFFCTARMLDQAEGLYVEMQNKGLTPSRAIKTMLIQAYGKAGRFEDADLLFKSIDHADAAAMVMMLGIYDTFGRKEEAMALSKTLMDSDILAYNKVIMHFARKGMLDKVENLYYQMTDAGVKANEETIVTMIATFGRKRLCEKALNLFEEIHSCGSPPTLTIHNAMIDTCIKCERWKDAHNLFQSMEALGLVPDSMTITMMVNAYRKTDMFREAAALVKKSSEYNIQIDTAAYNTFIKLNYDAGNMNEAVRWFFEMQSTGILPSLETYSLMIRCFSICKTAMIFPCCPVGRFLGELVQSVYGKSGDIDKAVEIFDFLKNSGQTLDEISYSAMIDQYGKAGKQKEAAKLFQEMQQEGIQPHEVTYHIMMNMYAKMGHTCMVEELFEEIQQRGFISKALTYLPLFMVYGRSGTYEKLEMLLLKMYSTGLMPDVKHFQELMMAYGKKKMVAEAYGTYKEIEKAKLLPDLVCHKTMLRIFIDNECFNEGVDFYEKTSESMMQDAVCLSLAVDAYEGSGRHLEGREILKQMQNQGLRYIWRRNSQK